MLFPAIPALVTGLVLTTTLPPALANIAPVAMLRGEWCLAGTRDEYHMDPGCDASTMCIRADGCVRFRLADVTTTEGCFTLRRSGTVIQVDLALRDGRTLLGLCAIKGDELSFCFEEAGKSRPAGLAPTGTQWAERWTHVRH